jgi:hypothetical protein
MMRVVHQRPMLANVQKRKIWLRKNPANNMVAGCALGAANPAIATNQPPWSNMNKG